MDQIELRYQAVQCHVRARRAANDEDARWLEQLAIKLAGMADAEDARQIHYAGEILRKCA